MSKRGEIPGPGIERAGAYKTADGKLHATRDEARLWNARLGLLNLLTRTMPAWVDDEAPEEALAGLMIQFASEFYALLKEAVRKPASKPTEPTE